MKLHELRAMRHKRSMAPRIEKIPKYKYRINYNFSKALKKAEKGHLFSILEIIDCYHRGIGGVKKEELLTMPKGEKIYSILKKFKLMR